MPYLLSVLLVLMGFAIGYYARDIMERLIALEVAMKDKVGKKPAEPTPPSRFIDPNDPLQAAKFEFEERMRDLNRKDEE